MDNFHQIRSLLKFQYPGDFYFIQLFKRRKDNPDLNKSEKLIKSYSVYSLEDYDTFTQSIKDRCAETNSRAYIRLNKRNSRNVGLHMIKELSDSILTGNHNHIHKIYDSVVGKYNSDENKTWIIDVDGDEDLMYEIARYYETSQRTNIYVIKTINGYHLVVKPFDSREFRQKYPTIDIHKDNPTLLFANLKV